VSATSEVTIEAHGAQLDGELTLPDHAGAIVVFAHGSGSSRHSPRGARTGELRFDIPLLSSRLIAAIDWLSAAEASAEQPIGTFGASTGAAAALVAAAERPDRVGAVVSRGGRPDLAGDALPNVKAPTLMIVGGADRTVLDLNQTAVRLMRTTTELEVIPGATHLFEEPGALEQVAELARDWFVRWLVAR
jgi:putative phosphoribosyl transferase